LDADSFDAIAEGPTIGSISIPQQIAGRSVPWEGLGPLTCKPVLRRIFGDLEVNDLAALMAHLALKGKEPPVLDGFTGDQRLFLGYAQSWRYKSQEETARQRVLTDPHSPPEFRVIGTVRNVDAWYDAMGVKPGEKYYFAPEARVHLW